MTERIADQTAQSRFTTWVMGAFAAIALLLSAIGIYGVMSYLVAQRTREVGIRIALGATPRQIVRLIVGRGALLVGTGIVAGAAASIALQRVMSTLSFRRRSSTARRSRPSRFSPATGVLACYVPALRAARVDPLVALRAE